VYTSDESIRSGAGRWSTVLSGSAGPVLVLEDPSEGGYMYVSDLYMSCGKETPSGPNRYESPFAPR
jgi:hypothetical protein